ncbi:MAG: hypothetical protein ACT4QE_11095, partial [Anaerolineales bacterium]
MKRLRQLNRREFLGMIGRGTVALVAELTIGPGRNVLAIALGGSSLSACTVIGGGVGLDESPTAGAPSATPLSPTSTTGPTASSPTATSIANATATATAAAGLLTYLPIAAGVANAYVLVRGEEVAIV